MHLDLSDLQRSITGSSRQSHAFNDSTVYSIPEAVERSKRVANRIIDKSPFRILDAPGLIDDYYLNLLDWTGPLISIALGDTIYGYNVDTKEVSEMYATKGGYISSLKGMGNELVIGESTGRMRIVDIETGKVVTSCKNHKVRICSIAMTEKIITSGDKEGKIVNIDKRKTDGSNESSMRNTASRFIGHSQEVCGMKWYNGYLATGSNDNTVRIWKMGSPISRVLEGHRSAIKALDWCPWRSNILVTGGGSKDKTIRFWDTEGGKCIRTTNVDSQVCSLVYLNRYKELISSHGYSENDLRLWRVSSGMKFQTSFGKHESRVLHTALSPDECSIVSLGADESLKFWKVAEVPAKAHRRDSIGLR
ncbi:cell division cycle 20, cofactor of APC complex [Pancytospora epiphaga]|nr:cell division cycle 20, cofactor of APC complex [Pancytospora epiphaga]